MASWERKREESKDIAEGLKSLSFEKSIEELADDLIKLRFRAHRTVLCQCAIAVYFVTCLDKTKEIAQDYINPATKYSRQIAKKFGQEVEDSYSSKVGIIGCGKLGVQLIRCLLEFGRVKPNNIMISSEKLPIQKEFGAKGVQLTRENKKIAQFCDILFIAVQPSQLYTIAKMIRDFIGQEAIIYSFVAAIPTFRMIKMFRNTNIIRHCINYKPEDHKVLVSNTNMGSISTCLSNQKLVEQTCPLYFQKYELPVDNHSKMASLLVHTILNTCSSLRISGDDSLLILNEVLFTKKHEENHQLLTYEDICVKPETRELKQSTNEEHVQRIMREMTMSVTENDEIAYLMPIFNLSQMLESEQDAVQLKLLTDLDIRTAFFQKYISVFHDYIQWKKWNS